jgi:hypothetical protein
LAAPFHGRENMTGAASIQKGAELLFPPTLWCNPIPDNGVDGKRKLLNPSPYENDYN